MSKERRTIYNALCINAARLSRPMYDQLYRHRGDLRLYRVLTAADVRVLRQYFGVRVKR